MDAYERIALIVPDIMLSTSSHWLLAGLLLVVPTMLFLHRRMHRDGGHLGNEGLDFLELEPRMLPPEVRQFFDTQHPAMMNLGFSFVGDCQIIQGPQPVFCRYYAGPDGRVYAEVAVARFGPGRRMAGQDLQAITLVTVFEDGNSMQTCDLGTGAAEDTGPDPSHVIYRFRPGTNLPNLMAGHLKAIEAYAEQHRTQPLRYPPDQIVEVSLHYAECQRASEFAPHPVPAPYDYQAHPGHVAPVTNMRSLAFAEV